MRYKIRSARLFYVALLGLVFTGLGFPQAKDWTKVFPEIQKEASLSRKDIEKIQRGEPFTKRVKTKVKQEAAIMGVIWISVPPEFFVKHYSDEGMHLELIGGEEEGVFSLPPIREEIAQFLLPASDGEFLKNCRVGKCKVRLPEDLINRIAGLDSSSPTYMVDVNALFQDAMYEYLLDYLERGDAALAVYHDKKNPLEVSKEFRAMLEASPVVKKFHPELLEYMIRFPRVNLQGVQNILYWMREYYGAEAPSPILSLNQSVRYVPEGRADELVVATKQLFVTHYYEALLGWSMVVPDRLSDKTGFYFLHYVRGRFDILRTIPGFLAGKLFKAVQGILLQRMMTLKERHESLYQASKKGRIDK